MGSCSTNRQGLQHEGCAPFKLLIQFCHTPHMCLIRLGQNNRYTGSLEARLLNIQQRTSVWVGLPKSAWLNVLKWYLGKTKDLKKTKTKSNQPTKQTNTTTITKTTTKQENGRIVRLCPLLWKTTTIDVHFVHAGSSWLFIIPMTKHFLDFVYLFLECGSNTEATHFSPKNLKMNKLTIAKLTIVNDILLIYFNM